MACSQVWMQYLVLFTHCWQVRPQWTALYKQPLISTLFFIHKNNFVLMVNKKNLKTQCIELPWIKRHSKVKVQNDGPKASAAEISQYVHLRVQRGNFKKKRSPLIGQNSSGSAASSSGITKPSCWKMGQITELSGLMNVKSQTIFKNSDIHLRLWHREYPQSFAV